jgi:pyridoxamine 5'-phosphate oxidase
MNPDIANIRTDYKLKSLSESEVKPGAVEQFSIWWNEALQSDIYEVNAMTLATADKNGHPLARIVLLKGYDESGFVFFTNYESRKGNDLAQNPQACLLFFWKELERQVRIEGVVEKVDPVESDAYFNSRPEGSKVGAWASPQSQPIPGKMYLENRFVELSGEYKGKDIPRPAHWGGYIVKPAKVEFWQGRPSRLHDRILYTKNQDGWKIERLAP